jgi:hypothetical protein
MKSPFPGMDPFLELHWGDVHHRLITYMSDAIQVNLPDDLLARVEERVFVEADLAYTRRIVPDVRVVETVEPLRRARGDGGVAVAVDSPDVAEAEPYVFELYGLEITEGFIEIREKDGGRVVTVIELLSRANKLPGPGQEQYRKKQNEVLHSTASLVEIDLVRVGSRVLSLPTCDIPEQHRNDYLVCISPGWNRSRRELYAMPMQKRLPIIRIPLRDSDAPVKIDLQSLLNHAYEAGRFDRIDYSQELDPPLTAEESAWVKNLTKKE